MSELEDKLNTLLSDPDGMAQVFGLAQKLSEKHDAAPPPDPSPDPASPPADPLPDLSTLLAGLFGGDAPDAQTLSRLLPVLRRLDRPESGETAALLYALRPYLRPSRRDKVERAVRLARLLHLGLAFLGTKEGEYV